MKIFLFLTAGFVAAAGSLHAQSAWLPESGQLIVTPGYSYQTIQNFWAGPSYSKLPVNLIQHNAYLSLEYGLGRQFAADVTFGYSRTRFSVPGEGSILSEGFSDTQFGLRYRFLDERTGSPATPSLALRIGGVIAGNYKLIYNSPVNPGDGANGLEFSLLAAKTFGKSGFSMFGDIGWRLRDNHVPNDIFGRIGFCQQIGQFTIGVNYREVHGLSGGDIGGPGFGTTYGFQNLREIDRAIDTGVTFTDRGGRSYQFTYSKTIDGRNTGDKSVFGFSVSVPVGGTPSVPAKPAGTAK